MRRDGNQSTQWRALGWLVDNSLSPIRNPISLRWAPHRQQYGLGAHVLESELLDGVPTLEEIPDPVLADVQLVNVQRQRSIYLLDDVVFEPRTGDVVVDGRPILESRPYSWNRVSGPLMPTGTSAIAEPIVTGARRCTYYHWMLEELPALLFARQYRSSVVCLVNGPAPSFVTQSARALGLTIKEVTRPQRASRFVLVDRCAEFDWPRNDSVEILRSAVADLGIVSSGQGGSLFVSRRGSTRAGGRATAVEQLAASLGYRVVRFHEMDWLDQLRACSQAAVVVGLHGAGFANLIAAAKGTVVHEVMSPAFTNPVYEILSRRLGLDYVRTIAEPDDMSTWETVLSAHL